VHVRKNNGEIRLYLDIMNLNKASLKDNYPLWGTFAYIRMPFGFMNVGGTLQRAMEYSLVDIKDLFIMDYVFMNVEATFQRAKDYAFVCAVEQAQTHYSCNYNSNASWSHSYGGP
jgi:hypothetical protein